MTVSLPNRLFIYIQTGDAAAFTMKGATNDYF
jgi:hypothetical protein